MQVRVGCERPAQCSGWCAPWYGRDAAGPSSRSRRRHQSQAGPRRLARLYLGYVGTGLSSLCVQVYERPPVEPKSRLLFLGKATCVDHVVLDRRERPPSVHPCIDLAAELDERRHRFPLLVSTRQTQARKPTSTLLRPQCPHISAHWKRPRKQTGARSGLFLLAVRPSPAVDVCASRRRRMGTSCGSWCRWCH
jgi:hypothetical protein